MNINPVYPLKPRSTHKGLGIFLNFKLSFHNHANHIFTNCIKLLGLVISITFTLSLLNACTDCT
jgi:hypothetical protein